MKVTEDLGKYGAELGFAEENGLKQGPQAKAREFEADGAKLIAVRKMQL